MRDEHSTPASAERAAAPRRRRRGVDARLALGALLVAGSVVGVLAIVGAADASVTVYVTRSAIAPGDRLLPADLELAPMRADGSGDPYLSRDELPAEGVIAQRAIGAGEFVPQSAVGRVESERLAAIVVAVEGELSRSIRPGAAVDVWASAAIEQGRFGPPVVLVPSATVIRIAETEGIVATDAVAVEVLVPRDRTARLIAALANGDSISLVPAAIPVGG